MLDYKLSKEVKKRMDQEFKQYYINKKQLNKLISNNKSSTRKYIYLEQRLNYVENVYNSLTSFEKEVYNLIFKEKCNAIYGETNLNISKSTYNNIYNKCITLLAKEWGEI